MEQEAQKQHPGISNVLRIRSFAFLWASQITSQVAFNMLNFVLVFRVYHLTSSNTAVSALILFFQIPQLLLSVFAGALVDRLEKKLVMLLSNVARAIFLLPLIFLDENVSFIYICAFGISIATQFFLPAEAPMIPKLVKNKPFLLPANSLFTGTLYGSIIVGYILAGPSLKVAGVMGTFLFIGSLFVAAACFNSLLPGKTAKGYFTAQVQKVFGIPYLQLIKILFNDIAEALFLVVRSSQLLFSILFLTISQAVIVSVGALLPGYASTVLSLAPEDASLILLAPAAFGMVIGSFFVARVGPKFGKDGLILTGVTLSGIMLLLLPLFSRINNSHTFFSLMQFLPFDLIQLVIVDCFLLGFFNAMVIIPANIVLQEKSSDAIRGRIYGLFNGLAALFSIPPVALSGYFSDIIGVGRVLTCIGFTIVMVGLFLFIKRRGENQ